MTVPFSEAVAIRVPSLFIAIQDSGELWAPQTLTTLPVKVSYIMISPVVEGT